MEPLPETVTAIEELGPFASERDLLDQLRTLGDRVLEVVPDCVGLSLASSEHGVTFTLVADSGRAVLLDVVRHQDGRSEPDAGSWRVLSLVGTGLGVASSWSLPIGDGSGLAGCVYLYGASVDSFEGRHEQLADILGGGAHEGVADTDVAFSTSIEAVDAPRRLLERSTLAEAADVVAELLGVGAASARDRIDRAARRAGLSGHQLAEALLKLHGR